MRSRFLAVLLSALVVVGAGPAAAVPESSRDRERYIVVFHDWVADVRAVAQEHERAHGADVSHVYEHALKGYAASFPQGRVEALRYDPRVAYFELDGTAHISAQTLPTGINRMEADQNSVAKIDGVDDRVDVDIAIIDTGIDLLHPDLNVVSSTDCSTVTCIDGGGNDDNGHGTHVAGTAAAIDNGTGVVGVAPGARLHAVKVLTAAGAGTTSAVIAGIDWVTKHASTIEVANMSLGGEGYSKSEHDAVKRAVSAGVVVVVAAGNESVDVYGKDGTLGGGDDTVPAAFPEAMTISALADFDGAPGGKTSKTFSFSSCSESKDDSFACFSNYSRSVVSGNPVKSPGAAIDLMLPGVGILSTYAGGLYATASGTSMASPHAAGLVAAYIAANGRATNAQGVYNIRQALIDAGQSQTGSNGLTTHDDPDANKESLGWALWSGGGTTNAAPLSSFNHSCSGLTCSFTDTSTDSDGSIVSWSWSFGDNSTSTAQHPSHTYGQDGTYTVSLTVTDDAGATSTASKTITVSSSGITLTTRGYKVKGTKYVDLSWSGATSTNVDVYRNGVLVTTTANDGAHTDAISAKGGGTYAYKVCEAGTTKCSNESSVTF